MGAIHPTKIQTGSNRKSGPPQNVDQIFRNFSGWAEPIEFWTEIVGSFVEWIAPYMRRQERQNANLSPVRIF